MLSVASALPAFASVDPVRIQILPASETVREMRYQSGAMPDQAWMSAPLEAAPLALESFDSDTDFVFVQQAVKENVWSEMYAYRHDSQGNSWSLVSFPPEDSTKATDDATKMNLTQDGEEPTKASQAAEPPISEYLAADVPPFASKTSENPVRIQILPASETIREMRYQSGAMPDQAWMRAPLEATPLALEGFDSDTEFLFVQQAEKENVWGEMYAYHHDAQADSWSPAGFPPEGPVRFGIRGADGSDLPVRYQSGIGPGPLWLTAEYPSSLLIENFDSGKELLFVQQEVAPASWGGTYAYRYDYVNGNWSLLPPEKGGRQARDISLDVKGYALLPTGCSSDFYSYLLGGGVQANISLGRLLGYAALTFSKGPPKSAWVRSQQALALSVGFGYEFPLSGRLSLIPEVGYGLILHLLDADFDKDGTYRLELFADQQVRLALYVAYALNERQKLFIAPLGVLFFEKEDFGIMYGCQAGLRVSL